ncbi:MAG TPA: tetratricopeptide repeat protein, partial [Candidatus Acidoferrum sp.]
MSVSAFSASQTRPSSSPQFDQLAAKAAAARDKNLIPEAIALYQKALALRPGWAEGWWSLGTLFYDSDAYGPAARAFRKVVQLKPKHGSALVMLGLCEFELGQDAASLRDLRAGRALGILDDPQLFHVLLYHEGVLFLRTRNFSSAQEALGSLAREDALNDEATLQLGMAMLRVPPQNLPPEGFTGREVITRVGRAQSLIAQKKFAEG